jgi:HPt (histidine-containing phosphotransfer) domain-containing protein
MKSGNKVQVIIDADLQDIVPNYIESVSKDLVILSEALTNSHFDTIETIGHRMKGVAKSYGFPFLTELGKTMELAAKEKNKILAENLIKKLQDYLNIIEIK